VATSGHSGVDRIVRNLTSQFDAWDIGVDLLQIRSHGPHIDISALRHARIVDLGISHVNTALPALVRWLRSERPSVLLTDKDRVNRVAIIAKRIAAVDTRLVVRLGTTVSVNLADRGRFERWTQRTSIRHLYRHADAVIVPSYGVAEDLSAYTGLDREHIQVVRNPLISPRLAELAAQPIAHPWLAHGQPPVILGAGELGFRKDFATLVRAFARVRRHRECRLIILGRGRKRAELAALAGSLGVADAIDFPGFDPNPYAYMARAALFVLSSRWEGFGNVLVESLSVGTPVVSTDCPSGPRELLACGKIGGLVPVEDDEAMAAAVLRWMGRRPDPADLEKAVAPYRVEASARAYLVQLGLSHER
jgi:glycosyltransferase involved in cell wall biosynthesis